MNTQGKSRNSGKLRLPAQFFLIMVATLWMLALAASWADAANAADRGSEYSFNWLDPDKKIYVLQNRRYTKANRVMISAMAGVGVSNPYRDTYSFDPRVAYYFSESFGIEVFHTMFSNSENSTLEALKQAVGTVAGVLPVVREIKTQYGALAHYVPWYAKINVFNQILYFDWYFSGGVGQLGTDVITQTTTTGPKIANTQNLFGVFLGTGHQYHLNESLTVRLDFSGAFYQAPIFGNTGEENWFSNYTFGIGLGLRI